MCRRCARLVRHAGEAAEGERHRNASVFGAVPAPDTACEDGFASPASVRQGDAPRAMNRKHGSSGICRLDVNQPALPDP